MTPKKTNKWLYVIFVAVIYIFVVFLALHAGKYVAAHPDESFLMAFGPALDNLSTEPLSVLPLTEESGKALFFATVFYAIILLAVYAENERNRTTMPGKENGTTKWNDNVPKYNKKYTYPYHKKTSEGGTNIILTNDVQLGMDTRQTRRNLNVLVDGGSGAGKSRFFIKPNILQCCYEDSKTNLVVTDPSGELLSTMGGALEKVGYTIKVFNLVEREKSCCYNPFMYIRPEDDSTVLSMINCLITNTTPSGQTSNDPFWEKSETALLQALCFFLIKHRPKEEWNFTSVMRLLRAAEMDESNPNKKTRLDLIFEEVKRKDPECISLKQYQTFKLGGVKTLKSILISASVRLTSFNLKQIENLTSRDTIDLASLGTDKPTALFVVIPSADSTYNFLVSMMYSQLFETFYHNCETIVPNQLTPCPRHIRFLLDEFVNIGQIPDFTKKLATMRKYEISCSIIVQNLAQLKAMYKDDYETIIGNCDSFLFLGGSEYTTLEYISKELGDATITSRDNSRSRGRSGSSTLSYKKQSRKLLLPEEVGRIDESDCVLLIRGLYPFYGKKYDYPKHPNYSLTGDADVKQCFVNPYNNYVGEPSEQLEENYHLQRVQKLEQARLNPTPANKVFSDTKSIVGIVNTFKYRTENDIRTKMLPLLNGDEAATVADNGYSPELELTKYDSGFMTEQPSIDIDISEINENVNIDYGTSQGTENKKFFRDEAEEAISESEHLFDGI